MLFMKENKPQVAKGRYLFVFFYWMLTATLQAQVDFSVSHLTCEQEENPLGIENLHPRFSWQAHAISRNFVQTAYQVVVADTPEALLPEDEKKKLWDSGKVNSSESVLVPYRGKPLKSNTTYYWQVRIWNKSGQVSSWSTIQQFRMGLLTVSDWKNADWIALEPDKTGELVTTGIHGPLVQNKLGDTKIGMYQLPLLRKEFQLKKPLRHATAYISGLGQFEMFLNGKKVGANFLDPGWTKYDKCALYVSFDVKEQLQNGANAIGVMLGNGFYNIPRERYYKMLASYGAPKMIMKLFLEYEDGSTQVITSDKTWKATGGPITYSSIYGGEDYDAGKEPEGWMQPGFKDKKWKDVLVVNNRIPLLSQRSTPLEIRQKLPAVQIFQNEKGDWVYDLGQNFSGVVKLTVKATGNQTVKLYPAELLNPDKSVNQSASGAPYYFSYTAKGKETESWQPQFTYYGFRYVQIEGAVPQGKENPSKLPEIVELAGLHTCNSAAEVGHFTCSNPLYNKIYDLIDWAIRSNMASVFTDCPHREKLGWLEESHLMQYSIQYRYQVARLYEKIMNDIRSTQADNGMVPTIAPELVEFEGGFKDTPEWGSAFIIIPWYVYLWYGNKDLFSEYYPDMQWYIDYLSSRADNHIVAYGLGDWFDIGPNSPGEAQLTSNGVTATAIYYYDVRIMEKISRLLGHEQNAEKYKKLAGEIKNAFNEKFFDKTTLKYDRNSQAANAVALYMDLVEPQYKEQVLLNLKEDIRARENALTAGDVGYRYVLRALEENNASDIIYDMNSKYDVPGYGWQLAHGATALTESWQAYGFVSNNHCMLGHLMEWLFSGVGGIRQAQESVAFKNIVIKPEPVGDITSARTSYASPYGLIRCEWETTSSEFDLYVEIPANTQATVHIPCPDLKRITESGLPVWQRHEFEVLRQTKDEVVLKLGSGNYTFKAKDIKRVD